MEKQDEYLINRNKYLETENRRLRKSNLELNSKADSLKIELDNAKLQLKVIEEQETNRFLRSKNIDSEMLSGVFMRNVS